MSTTTFGVILAGGVGSRLWPQSRRNTPKHLLQLIGESSLLEMTHNRILGAIDESNIAVVTLAEQQREIREVLPTLRPDNLILEPVGRNTAPCIGLAALVLSERCPDALMAVMPADHTIAETGKFQEILRLAGAILTRRPNALITIGIPPRQPATGYGYIRRGKLCDVPNSTDAIRCSEVDRFVEKPPLETAKAMLAAGDYLWNAGIFFFRADTILREIEKHIPDLGSAIGFLKNHIHSPDFGNILTEVYEKITPLSIDNGVMQKSDAVLVIEADIGWDDVGSWASLADIWPCDDQGCASNCELIAIDSKNTVAFSHGRVVAVIGIDDVVIVDSDDAILVCRRDRAQDVRQIVQELSERRLVKHL
ncbi:mannose-1-phosphate guanylyltransferase [bacterium]|nr:mannose-1-phosphate guanylyltransferase [bacterium]